MVERANSVNHVILAAQQAISDRWQCIEGPVQQFLGSMTRDEKAVFHFDSPG